MVKFKEYYDTLGVSRTATQKDIKTAYRQLARKFHPDANKGDKTSEEKFKEIAEAYEVLKDPEKRKRYDRLGSNWKDGADFRPPPDFGGGFSFDFDKFGEFSRTGGPFSDFFDMLFGQTFGGGTAPGGQAKQRSQMDPRKQAQPFDQEAEIELTVEELHHGAQRTLKITPPGSPAKTVNVNIPAGVKPGSKVRVSAESIQSPAGGDVYLRVRVKPHEKFTIDGDNLLCEVELSPAMAVLGGQAEVPTLEGNVKIKIPAGTQNGKLLRLKGRGLRNLKKKTTGDLLIRTKIVVPINPSDEEKRLYQELYELEKAASVAAS